MVTTRKIFNHINTFQFPDVTRIDTDNGRFYTNGIEKYPSVTTILSAIKGDGLKKWEKRVGPEVANMEKVQASNRGSALHNLCEKYIANDPMYSKGHMPINMINFKKIKPILNDKVDNIVAIEQKMLSHGLQCGGTSDLIAEFDGKLSIIDFKTAKKRKQKSWLKSYLTQAAIYSYMFEEIHNAKIELNVLIFALDNSKIPQVVESNPGDYIKYYDEYRAAYDKQ